MNIHGLNDIDDLDAKDDVEDFLADTTFDRSVAPRDDERINFLVDLFLNGTRSKKKAIDISTIDIDAGILRDLARTKRIAITGFKKKRVYLSKIGAVVALGELSLRRYDD
jgi:hypothetical protein